jgi:hypothetical protein
MVKTFLKIKKSKTLRPRRIRGGRAERRKAHKIKEKKKEEKDQISKISYLFSSMNIHSKEDILSRYSKDRIEFLFDESENVLNDYLTKEIEEFIPYISQEPVNPSMKKQRNCVIYGLFDLMNKITTGFNYTFPENYMHSVIALYDYFLAKSQKEMKFFYMGRTMYACMDIIDKESGLGLFLNDDFQNKFTTDDEIDVLETTDFKLYPIKPFDYFSQFCFNAHVIKREDSDFLNYLKKFQEKFDKIAFYFLINEETKLNKPSTNYFSIFSMAYEETKNELPNGDNFINDYMNKFKNRIQYSNEDLSLAKNQLEESISLVEEAKLKYAQILEGDY